MKSYHQKIYLIRHGETEWTKSNQHTGLTDIPLTDKGRSQAIELKEHLKGLQFKKVFCSPLIRAKETCEIAGFFEHAKIDEDLYEWNYGDYEGKTTEEIRKTDPKWDIFTSGAPRGESIADVGARARKMIGKVHAVEGDVALFSSSHFLRSLTCKWLNQPLSFGKHILLSTASISILGTHREDPVILLWNRQS